MPPFNADELEIVPGGRKKRCIREAYIFMRHKHFPSVLVRKFGLASDFDEVDRNRWDDGDKGAGPGDGEVDGRVPVVKMTIMGVRIVPTGEREEEVIGAGANTEGAFREQTAAEGVDREQVVQEKESQRR